ncbi:MAG: malto-oligosyltrehalose synthase [Dermabacter sp.]|nr:malto-oligosyltrehalose synthase [Dermabacter sp.]
MSVDPVPASVALDRGQAASPAPSRPVRATYRLQIHGGFTYADAARLVPYLARLGISHVFVSPILQAAPGSTHGYDVVDHAKVSDEYGGEEGLRALADALHARDMGLIVDVVPNHMAIPTPIWHNRALWSLLKRGEASEYATWFDIDTASDYGILLPVLGRPIGAVLTEGELSVQREQIPQADGTMAEETVLRYFDHVFPVAEGTEDLPLIELVEAQVYRLAYWKVANDELNYRRFFDVETLWAVRVEDPEVFEATHRTLLRLQADGVIDGYRIDHPDGLANPRGYLENLATATGGAWTVVEKILEGDERLPDDFPVAGTTGYDALWRVGGLFHSAHGALGLTRLWQTFTGDMRPFEVIAAESAEEIIDGSLWAEIERLTSLARRICEADIMLRDTTGRQIEQAIMALLTSMDRYRAYIVPGERAPAREREVIYEAAARAATAIGEDEDDLAALDIVASLVLGEGQFRDDGGVIEERAEFMIRFAQTCGPVHAKAMEDTAFYRYNRFVAVNEVGASPDLIGVGPEAVHDHCLTMLRTFPLSMTTLSTHDTKRSEDVRARLAALTESPAEWAVAVAQLHVATESVRGERVDPGTELLVWQILAALWPVPGSRVDLIDDARLVAYLEKAMREAKVHTAWVDGDEEYESEIIEFALAALHSPEVAEILTGWTTATATSQRVAILGQKLIQLTMPGVPDIYQGNESIDLSLVDPDNRRPVDHARNAERLEALLAGEAPEGIADEKLLLTARALEVRARFPEAFIGEDTEYRPVPTTTAHAFAFARAEGPGLPARSVTVATRLPRSLSERGGWDASRIVIDEGCWRDVLTGRSFRGPDVPLADLLEAWPVALLVRADDADDTDGTGGTGDA